MFRIVVIGWKAEAYVPRCLGSLISQTVTDWTACVVVDPSDDRSVSLAGVYANDSRIRVVANDKQMYALPNIIRSINEQHPADDDIIATVDLDDWLSGRDSLEIVKRYYDQNPALMLTHGSWVSFPNPGAPTNNRPYSAEDWAKGVRRVDWRASHLRTFKYRLWKHVRDEDLKNSEGEYYRSAWDLAMVYPMMEVCGPSRVQYVSERIYTYNQETPFNDSKMRLQEQMRFADEIVAKQPYSFIDNP
jgi:glycosyltransferase involved in cell wall biosynthesis